MQPTIRPNAENRELARRLVAHEHAAMDAHEANTPAVLRVSEKLRRRLSTLTGPQGFRALLTRALVLAKAEVPAINGMQVKPDGSLDGFLELEDRVQAEAAGIEVLAQLIGLLSTFIGQRLTLNLLLDEWPEFQIDNLACKEYKDDESTR